MMSKSSHVLVGHIGSVQMSPVCALVLAAAALEEASAASLVGAPEHAVAASGE